MSFAPPRRFFRLGLVAFLWAGLPLHAEPIEEGSIWMAERTSSPTELAVRLRPLTRGDWNGWNLLRLPDTRRLRRGDWDPDWSWLVSHNTLLERWSGPMVLLPEGPSLRLPDLQAELRNARLATMDGDDILVEFVVRNISDRDIVIASRRSSWFGHQFEIELRDASGTVWNFLMDTDDLFGGSGTMTFPIRAGRESAWLWHLSFATSSRKGWSDTVRYRASRPTPWQFPVHLRGRFGTEGLDGFGHSIEDWRGRIPNWSGMIWSDEITVER